MASTCDHPHSGAGPREDSDPDGSDTGSVICDDSLLPNIERRDKPPQTLYEACAANDAVSLRSILEKGVSKDQAMHLDINGRSGLMVAVSKDFVDVVSTLHVCPLIDVNHQDNDGNSALMIAAQAGFTTILNFILNYYSGVDTELRDPRGFTALMKAGLQGREDCVSTLLMHGADMNARDHVQADALKDWVLKTGRFETLSRIRRLQARPVAEQFCERYAPEWPQLRELVAKATGSKSTGRKLRRIIKNLTFSFPHDPQDNGVMDHMVRVTTGIRSPLVATACHPLCLSSPPQIRKRGFALPELLEEQSSAELEERAVSHSKGPLASASSVRLSPRCQEAERGESAPPGAVRGFIPRSVAHRNSIFPTVCTPKIEVTKSGEPTPKTEKKKNQQNGYLELPVWRYKEKKRKEKQKEMEQERISEGSENIDKT
ncbi:photoreceptor ankyrin repeat protein [Syngnathus typhle]|uniref:photoreceptor ankyrin repeat protein n=1 Tax=Syngnathus typhle TaxID=161592 RepID=UPI002A6ABF76|nr:photoreceptor ankyrin repeat protein [Syngnathus typhle]XP_061126669.1 photoreceptor ankyrin repeat protein [Syngnathus typhle]